MNTTVSTVHDRRSRSSLAESLALPQRASPRVRLLDRLALRVGLALLSWGRRPVCFETRAQRVARVESEQRLFQRRLAAEQRYRLLVPHR